MPDPVPVPVPATPQTIIVHSGHFRLLNILSVVNAVVLLLIIVGVIIHHHKMKRNHDHGVAGGGQDGGCSCERGFHGGFHGGFARFHHFRHFGSGGRGFEGGSDRGFRQDEDGSGPRGGFDRADDQGGMDGMSENGFHHGMDRGGFHRDKGMDDMTKNPDRMTDTILQHLANQLSLTDDQKAKIKPLIQANVAQFQKDSAALHDAVQKDLVDARDKIKPLLNPDQQKQLDQLPMPGQKPADESSSPQQPAAAK